MTDHLEQRLDLGQHPDNDVVYEPIDDLEKWQGAGKLPPWEEREKSPAT